MHLKEHKGEVVLVVNIAKRHFEWHTTRSTNIRGVP